MTVKRFIVYDIESKAMKSMSLEEYNASARKHILSHCETKPSYGRIAYEAFALKKAFPPEWVLLSQKDRDCWEAIAETVVNAHRRETTGDE